MLQERWVDVDDRIQHGYRYQLTAPIGEAFDPAFKPEVTPAEMLEIGVFGGKYLTDCRAEFPAAWFARARLSPGQRDKQWNFFGVLAGQPLAEWRRNGAGHLVASFTTPTAAVRMPALNTKPRCASTA